jgi:hypothetical protein
MGSMEAGSILISVDNDREVQQVAGDSAPRCPLGEGIAFLTRRHAGAYHAASKTDKLLAA